ncbi:hypothetical protein Tco_0086831 [Tanacetum coccineum]
MYRLNTRSTQTRTSQLPRVIRRSNPRLSTFTRVTYTTSVSRPLLKSTQMNNRIVQKNSQVKHKKLEVEEHRRISKFLNNTKFVTVCNDSLNVLNSNVKFVCVPCGKCVFNANHDISVSKYIYDMNARTKKPQAVPIRYKWKPKDKNENVTTSVSLPIESESRLTNGSKPTNDKGSNLSNSSSSSNSFTDLRNHPIHRRIWMHKAHDGKPQVAN